VAALEKDEFLTADEACARLGIKPATLYAYVSRGLLPSFRQGIRRRRLYRRQDVEQLLAVRPSNTPEPVADPPAAQRVPRAEDWIPYVN
jgi:excisionase family DNA binding protein